MTRKNEQASDSAKNSWLSLEMTRMRRVSDDPLHRFTKNPQDEWERGAALADARVDAELVLLAAVLASPRRGFRLLAQLGATLQIFEADDIRAIAVAVETYLDATDDITRLVAARVALKHVQHWDESNTRPFVSGSLWGNESLVHLFKACSFDPELIEAAARKLWSIDARRHGIREEVARG